MRKKVCSYFNCTSNEHNASLKFFHFPKNPTKALKWLEASGNTKLTKVKPKNLCNYFLCEKHFDSYKDLDKVLLQRCQNSEFSGNLDNDEYLTSVYTKKRKLDSKNEPLHFFDQENKEKYTDSDLEILENIYKKLKSKDKKSEVEDEGICILHNNPIDKPQMVTQATQTEDMFDDEPSFSLFCCTFHDDKDAETFCHLKKDDLIPIPAYHMNKIPSNKKYGQGKKRRKKRRKFYEEKHVKRDDGLEVQLYESRNFEHYLDSKDVVIRVSEIHCNSYDKDKAVKNKKQVKPKATQNLVTKRLLPRDLCALCNRKQDKFQCRRIAIHKEYEFRCKFCNVTFDKLENLITHVKNNHLEKLLQFTCDHCYKIFKCEYKYFLHTSSFKCKACTSTFNCFQQLKEHKKSIHPVSKPRPLHQCYQCFQKFTWSIRFAFHTQLNKCHLCDKTFDCRTRMRNHQYTTHHNLKCDVCFKIFKSYRSYTMHINRHKDKYNKKFSCPVCQKDFSTKQFLENHIRIHTGDKPFLCDICGSTFKQSGALYSHVHGVHGIYKTAVTDDGNTQIKLVKESFSGNDRIEIQEENNLETVFLDEV